MAEKEEMPLEYRRYLASLGLPVSQPESQAKTEDTETDAEKSPAQAAKAAPITPYQKLRLLEGKVENNVDDPKLLNEFIKLGYEMEEFELIADYVRRYLGRHSRDNGIRQSYAMILLRIGNRRRAKIELRRILTNNPKFKPAREALDRMRKGEM